MTKSPQLEVIEGPRDSLHFLHELTRTELVAGRAPESGILLADRGVSRRHFQLTLLDGRWFVEDLGSSNGTYVNGLKILQPLVLRPGDHIKAGPFTLAFSPGEQEFGATILDQKLMSSARQELFDNASGRKLRAVLDLTASLGGVNDPEGIFLGVARHLFTLFPVADRVMLIDGVGESSQVVGALNRAGESSKDRRYSRSVLRRVTSENLGIIASRATGDLTAVGSTLGTMGVQSFACVPLHNGDNQVTGAILVDRFEPGPPFSQEDLSLLTAIAISVSISLENGRLQKRLVDQARLQRDMAVAREIQQSYLPDIPTGPGWAGHEAAATLHPAREVAGDFYDVLTLSTGATLFLVGDVSGKGIPAALFLASVRTLIRHFAAETTNPGELLRTVNNRLAADNPKMMFVTLLLALVQPDGEIILASGGHPPPARFRPGTPASFFGLRPGRLLGIDPVDQPFPTTRLRLSPGETLLMYTDGVNEAPMAEHLSIQFGNDRLCALLNARPGAGTLASLHEELCAELTRFSGTSEFEDDVTLLSLRLPL
jgi:serine phosphatase RsbU (regulator of sigma subunit)/pSer/pThr/pTyr-binding forkhead associated (FHA) protein